MSTMDPKPYTQEVFNLRAITGLLIDEQEHKVTLEHTTDIAAGFSLPTAPKTGYKLCLLVGKVQGETAYRVALLINNDVVMRIVLDQEGNVCMSLPIVDGPEKDTGGVAWLQ